MKPNNNEQGLVSLFTTILISLLLIIITTSLVTLEVLQLRKSEDSEQSLRAYYIAEAGIESAVNKILANPTDRTDQNCTDSAAGSTNYDLSDPTSNWTCQRISFSGSPMGTLVPDQGKTVDPGKVIGGYRSVIVEWGQSNNTDPTKYSFIGANLPSDAGYQSSAYKAPPIEIALVTYPDALIPANTVGGSIKLENALIVPRGTGFSPIVDVSILPGHGQWQGNCGPSSRTYINGMSGYNCYAILNGLNGSTANYIFRLRSRYEGAAFRMTFMSNIDGGGAVVKVPDGTATIDVTAKAGMSHRRVLTKLPLGTGAAPGLDYVIYSDNDICKNFSVINNAFPSSPGC